MQDLVCFPSLRNMQSKLIQKQSNVEDSPKSAKPVASGYVLASRILISALQISHVHTTFLINFSTRISTGYAKGIIEI